MKEGILILELASLIIINGKINDTNIHNNNSVRNHIISGDSRVQIEQREREDAERAERDRQEADAREKAKRASRGQSYTGTGGEVTIIGTDTQFFNCVKYAKAKSGIGGSIGNGGRAGINSYDPRVGAIGVEKKISHVVYIEAIEGDKITITEANYLKGFITQRVLSINDFIGFVI